MMKYIKFFVIALLIGLVLMIGYYVVRSAFKPFRYVRVVEWMRNADAHPDWAVTAGVSCDDAPFTFPTDGYIGFIWDDSFRPGHRHQGLDIFAGTDVGITPVYAAYGGFLSRKPEWKSSVIIRIPEDPLNTGEQIWTYYTHMADRDGNSFIVADFPPGTDEVYVTAGTLLGYQGNFSGDQNNPTGVHLHFSIVKDDGSGAFMNELKINNTLDPSPYFNLPLNAKTNRDQLPVCGNEG